MTNSRSPHHSELTIVEYATGDTLHGQQRTDALRSFRTREALPGDLVFSMPDGTWSSYAGFVDWTGFEDTPAHTHEEQRAVFVGLEYRALEEEYTDLCALPGAHEAYKGTHILENAINYGPAVRDGGSFPEHCAEQMLDFYQAYDRRLRERKSALREKMAAMEGK